MPGLCCGIFVPCVWGSPSQGHTPCPWKHWRNTPWIPDGSASLLWHQHVTHVTSVSYWCDVQGAGPASKSAPTEKRCQGELSRWQGQGPGVASAGGTPASLPACRNEHPKNRHHSQPWGDAPRRTPHKSTQAHSTKMQQHMAPPLGAKGAEAKTGEEPLTLGFRFPHRAGTNTHSQGRHFLSRVNKQGRKEGRKLPWKIAVMCPRHTMLSIARG